jgi:hypothetical protein
MVFTFFSLKVAAVAKAQQNLWSQISSMCDYYNTKKSRLFSETGF